MLKTTSAIGQGGQRIQLEDQGEKEPIQKSRKGQKGQKTAISKKWICAKKAKASRAKNLGQSRSFLTSEARKAFNKLRQAFVKVQILNHFDPERHIRIETDVLAMLLVGFSVT